MNDPTEPILAGDCHYCGNPVGDVFAGQYGTRIVRVRKHLDGPAGHEAVTSDEVWNADAEMEE